MCCFYNDQEVFALADPSGAYNMFIPLQSAGTSYRDLEIGAVDFVSQNILTVQPLDLSTLTTASPLLVPPLSGTCIDDDADAPDEDDPDCDETEPLTPMRASLQRHHVTREVTRSRGKESCTAELLAVSKRLRHNRRGDLTFSVTWLPMRVGQSSAELGRANLFRAKSSVSNSVLTLDDNLS